MFISIHAPAWGATVQQANDNTVLDISIHAPAWGATSPDWGEVGRGILFQSTLPHGERPIGTDLTEALRFISIHAPAWGATKVFMLFLTVRLFQSTLPHGERP